MKRYRVTIRYGHPQRYHMQDVQAASLVEAMRLAGERLLPEVGETADLLEIRVQLEPEDRQFGPG
jgi:hypothetical protein